jgi:hypothetical protein
MAMSDFFMIGTLVGLVFGLFHAVYMYGLVASSTDSASSNSRLAAVNFFLWTSVLWILMGAYLLGFWLISIIFYLPFKAFRQ